MLVDDETLFNYFDRHVSSAVFSHATFEKWRKQEESKNPDILKLTKADVFVTDADSTSDDYPSEIMVNNTRFKLQ